MKSNSPKCRDYFITCNQGAECFDELTDIIKTLNYKLYAYIYHDKDVIINEDGTETPKKLHWHLMIELNNPISFNSIQNKFKGAHIEIPKYKKSAYQYLIHNRPNAKDKYQYDFDNIISNSPQELKFIIESEDFELFKENMFMEYICDGTLTTYQFCKRFGLNAYKQYWAPYSRLIEELQSDTDMIAEYKAILEERAKNEL